MPPCPSKSQQRFLCIVIQGNASLGEVEKQIGKNNDNPLFQYNLIEILTCGVVTFGIFYFTIANEKKNNQNTRIESIIELIDKKLRMVFEPSIDVTKQDEYLHSFRYLDNKILILEKMTKGLGCDKEISDIKSEKDKLDVYINENLNSGKFEDIHQKE